MRGAWVEIAGGWRLCWRLAGSLPVRGAWVEIRQEVNTPVCNRRRSPCGERGLKCHSAASFVPSAGSLPVRGAWVEIASSPRQAGSSVGRSPCGERGLKCPPRGGVRVLCSRSPCGERGLKL